MPAITISQRPHANIDHPHLPGGDTFKRYLLVRFKACVYCRRYKSSMSSELQPRQTATRNAATGNLYSAGRFAFQRRPDPVHRLGLGVAGSRCCHVLEDRRTRSSVLVRIAFVADRRGPRTSICAGYLRTSASTVTTAEVARRWECRYVARRRRIHRAARDLVPTSPSSRTEDPFAGISSVFR